MGKLRNWQHERFAQEIAIGTSAADAYSIAGYKNGDGRNHNRLLRDPLIAARIDEIRREKVIKARAARVPIDDILTDLQKLGVHQIADFFERNAAGIQTVRDLQARPEIAVALLRYLHEGLGIPVGAL